MRTFTYLLLVPLMGCTRGERTQAPKEPPATPAPQAQAPATSAAQAVSPLKAQVARFAPADLTADIEDLPASERTALTKIIEAAKLLDPIFDRQAYRGNPELRQRLARDASAKGRVKLEYFDIMRGPWDRQNAWAPFAIETARPLGAGFYPEDLTAEAFRAYVKSHPKDREALESLTTVVERQGDRLVAVPYSKAYEAWLKPAAEKLREAARSTQNASLKKFLELRADAFLSDEYYASDRAWMDLESRVEVTIGPYETYEDSLLGLKASFEAFVTVADPEASRNLAKYKGYLSEMEAHLPIPDAMKTTRGRESPIRVVDVVYTSGDARKSVQTIAFNLPNDERVRKEKGAKKVLLRNLIETKFEQILKPIAKPILDPEQFKLLSAQAFFYEVLFHELSHSLGPAFADRDGKQEELRVVFGPLYSPLEEAKADVMGAYQILFMIDKGELPKSFRETLLLTYFAGLFRSVRFGTDAAHGQGAALQINRFLNRKAARYVDGRFTVDLDGLEEEVVGLVRDLCILQHSGNVAEADAMLETLGVITPPIRAALERSSDVPIDVRPRYPLAEALLR